MTTCACPNPPGGKVSCAAGQFAYCHRVGTTLESGCISIAEPAGRRPSRIDVGPVLEAALYTAGFATFFDYRHAYILDADLNPLPWADTRDAGDRLYEAMVNGRVVALLSELIMLKELSPSRLLYVRFPTVWADPTGNSGRRGPKLAR